ncbi:MAG TPA: phosphoribosylglycinamide formyltransferase [Accumulibacter sp.]|uniref:Phosphoribosylglycinamide formyltransferase n=2 Tax=Candidatus Accumulibacter TaxID=327159 RepID=A0A080M1Z5_9PROT|nr:MULTISPECIES: phosphoribosylglycinamide formyltransferase [Candidatus Accumulibacter]KFB75307.1 MAG: Phosphoribosylglycinamide formyltransferase [Candidatus Accumulibacter cognatus]MBN8518777.1 phosphoribosylglycinamide formyltransferase [Accumulibacter sp.]MBO3711326.1 phosphoribosylglycinamide formyltransferase [Accumulibacter sp.]MCC2868707.1 phosphoribosylglycinamide formyltransferase [Candidatus Accumulibacter phosphatis]MCM8578927.1 phosphoribosylglycinamide formyltransferase [Accumul
MIKMVVLISGRGSNLTSLLNAATSGAIPARIVGVISNRPDAMGLQTAETHGVPTCVIDHRGFAEREQFDVAVAAAIDGFTPDLVVLAGFMRILGQAFVRRYENRLINIHPSLLPAFPGLHTHRRALAEGVRIHGCTVHFVTPDLDHGPVIVQAAVPVLDDDDEATLAARVLVQEHQVYPLAVRWFAEGRLHLRNGRVWLDMPQADGMALIAPQSVAG